MSKAWQPRFGPRDLVIESRTPLYEGFFQLQQLKLRYRTFAGGEMAVCRELFWREDAVCVLLFDPLRDEVVMIEQFRIGVLDHPRSPWLLELVAGIVEPGESAEQVAHREAEEEAGARLQQLIPITRYTVSPGGAHEYIQLFCARVDTAGLGGVHGLAGEGEDIQVHRIPLASAFAMVEQGQIDNGPSIIALQWLQLNLERVRQQFLQPGQAVRNDG